MKIIDCEQGTKEWHDSRRCRVTGTKLDDVMGTSLARVQLIAELIAEEATEQSKIVRATEEMERGNAEEAFAIRLFEQKTGKKVEKVGLCISDKNDWHALSPDGLIKSKKGYTEAVEVKNPDSKNVIFYRLGLLIPIEELGLGSWSKATKEKPSEFKPSSKAPFLGIPADYKWQCVNYFLVNEQLEKLHFVLHDARFIEEEAKITIITIERSNPVLQEAMKEAEEALRKFRLDWMIWKEIVLPTAF